MKIYLVLLAVGWGIAVGGAGAQEPASSNETAIQQEGPETDRTASHAEQSNAEDQEEAQNNQEQEPWRETRSENGRFVLRLRGGETERDTKSKAVYKAILFEQPSEGNPGKNRKRWETRLDNNFPPAAVQVRNDGRYVILLADSRRDVSRNAVTIYDEKGKRMRAFGLKELLRDRDLRNFKKEKETIAWLDGARYEFSENAAEQKTDGSKEAAGGQTEQFVITLHWGRELRIDLKQGRLLRPEETGEADAETSDDTPETLAEAEALQQQIAAAEQAMLEAERAKAAEVAVAEMLQQAEIDPNLPEEVQEQLRVALAARLAEAQAEAVAAEMQAREARQQTDAAIAVTEDQDQIGEAILDDPATVTPQPQTSEELITEETTATEVEGGVPVLSKIPVVEQFFRNGDPGNSAATIQPPAPAIMPPQPDPAKPVDYIAWANEINQTEGPNAAPILQSAVASIVEFQGDSDLYDRAMKGDAEALRSPEITSWLEANQSAFAQFRDAAQLEYKGMPMHSEDGTLLSVLLPHLAPIRQGAKGMTMQGKLFESEGRYDEAANSYIDVLRTGGQAGQGPTLIENLVGVASQSLATKSLLDEMANAPDGQLNYADLAQKLDTSYQPPRPMADSIQFERGFILDTIQRSFDYDAETGKYRPKPEEMQKVMGLAEDGSGNRNVLEQIATRWKMANMDYGQTLKDANAFYDKMTDAFLQPYPQSKNVLNGMEQQVERGIQNPLLRALLPSVSRANFIRTRADTERRATSAVANIMAWKQQNGSLPDSLEVFGDNAFTRDPFTGQRFQYRKDGDSFTLYSLGNNGTDDGGVHDPKAETNDMVFWPRPKENK